MSNPDGMMKLAIRRHLPEAVKRLLRLFRLAVIAPPPAAPTLPQELIQSCEFLPYREAMLDRLPKNGVIVELGTLYGDFSRQILRRCSPSALHLIDIDFSKLGRDVQQSPFVRLHNGLTTKIMDRFADDSFDFIYIDADHSYEAIKADIKHSTPKLKPGGIIAFNDFARIVRPGLGVFGVHQAVCEFLVEGRWQVVYFCFNGEALYDIALRKPYM